MSLVDHVFLSRPSVSTGQTLRPSRIYLLRDEYLQEDVCKISLAQEQEEPCNIAFLAGLSTERKPFFSIQRCLQEHLEVF